MRNPRFLLGMVFPNSMVFKNVVQKYAVLTRKELRFERNTKDKVLVRCRTSPRCPFWLYASSPNERTAVVMIKVYRPVHECSSLKGRVYHFHAPFIAQEYMDQFMADGNWSRERIQNAVNMDFVYQMAYRAKRMAKQKAQRTYEELYNRLESYAYELKKRNLGTSVWIRTELQGEVTRFKRIYIYFEALKKGWGAGCRPIIGLDGCDLRGVHKGQLLFAIRIDGNNGLHSIAYAIVE
ncbi:uncharacterized protein LOC112184519 [Rosa chinensis]|uniref:uncharacterized protein LOC112184519 n=1 Tax=Rosa chinensis TaxID=74649 RepID=UPI000D08E515|nr:uncharacterized protein LOC112184519 [Rosa chinensis]